MPRLTLLEPAGGRGETIRVHLDGEPRCTLPLATVREMGLEEGMELSAGEAERVLTEGRFREAMDRALDYLSYRSRSRAELERHLRGKGWEGPVVERVVARCRELDYLDDRAFAESWVRDRIRLKPRGRFRLLRELKKKGVPEADAEAGIDRAFREEGVTERELLERAARKRWNGRRTDDPRTLRRRLWGYLRRRGFRSHEIREVVDELMRELDG